MVDPICPAPDPACPAVPDCHAPSDDDPDCHAGAAGDPVSLLVMGGDIVCSAVDTIDKAF